MEWFYYNFAAGSFYTQKNFVAELIRFKLIFIHKSKTTNLLFDPPFAELGVTYALLQLV